MKAHCNGNYLYFLTLIFNQFSHYLPFLRHTSAHADSRPQCGRPPAAGLRLRVHSSAWLPTGSSGPARFRLRHVRTSLYPARPSSCCRLVRSSNPRGSLSLSPPPVRLLLCAHNGGFEQMLFFYFTFFKMIVFVYRVFFIPSWRTLFLYCQRFHWIIFFSHSKYLLDLISCQFYLSI